MTDPSASVAFVRRARAAGARADVRLVPGGDHAMLRLGAQAGFLADLFTTRTRFSGGRPQPRGGRRRWRRHRTPRRGRAAGGSRGEPWPVVLYMSVLLLVSALAVTLIHGFGRHEQRGEAGRRP
ncbi:hypothetical protein [Streptomyces violaceus]|uniref:hypothetical protein n=1 Tax=Streptomyces violaceus TaxID=1936 RepID=UPI003CD074B0